MMKPEDVADTAIEAMAFSINQHQDALVAILDELQDFSANLEHNGLAQPWVVQNLIDGVRAAIEGRLGITLTFAGPEEEGGNPGTPADVHDDPDYLDELERILAAGTAPSNRRPTDTADALAFALMGLDPFPFIVRPSDLEGDQLAEMVAEAVAALRECENERV